MNPFEYRDGVFCVERVPLTAVAEKFGTPAYVYSKAALVSAYAAFEKPLHSKPHLICYAMKANSNLAILNLFARLGSGFDIVSGGELERVLAAGGDPAKVVFSGVGKSEADMRRALEVGILCFNVESGSELRRLARVAKSLGRVAPVSLRVNPDVDPKTHPYISTGLKNNKFGVAFDDAENLYREAQSLPSLRVTGVDFHIGSQITEIGPFVDALDKVLGLVDRLSAAGIHLEHIDIGGGLGIRYQNESPPAAETYFSVLLDRLGKRPQTLMLEPGRALVGSAGLLLTRVEYLKHGTERNFAIVDAAMNDLMRPALYDAWHDIVAVTPTTGPLTTYEIVGPVCESGDFIGHARDLHIGESDLLAVLSAGAYGMSMASNYNTRTRVAEIMIDGENTHVIRDRESVKSLFALEHVLPK